MNIICSFAYQFFFNSQKQQKMYTLQDFENEAKKNQDRSILNNTDYFFYSLKDHFLDAYLDYRTKSVDDIIIISDRIWIRFVAITKMQVIIDLDYLQGIFNLELIEFKKEMRQYFA